MWIYHTLQLLEITKFEFEEALSFSEYDLVIFLVIDFYNPSHDILRLFGVLLSFLFTTSESNRDY